MSVDMQYWKLAIKRSADAIADEELQRRAWFGKGPEVSNPGEAFNQFFDDCHIEDFLSRDDTGLSGEDIALGWDLVRLLTEIANSTPVHIHPSELIDDPRWVQARGLADRFAKVL